ncbi:murein biosynthesis integral membrane protein MurJ, partial [Ornithinimicrobium cerasi]
MSGDASSARSLARSSLVMAGGTFTSRILGVVRMALLAWVLGTRTPAANVWQTSNTLPNTIYLLLAAGVLNVLLLPQLTRAMTRGKEGQEYSDRLLTLSVVVLTGGTVLFVLAAPLVTKLVMLDYPRGDPMLELAILFAYLCIPQMLFYGLHTLLGQILAAHHRFAAFAWSPALANIVTIAGLLLFARLYPDVRGLPVQDWTGGMIAVLAGSATLGIVLQALVLFPAVRATGFTWRFRWGFRGVGLGTASVMAGWALADVAVSQTGVITATNLLNRAVRDVPDAPGKASYDYAFSIFILPHSLIALSLLTAIYPVLSRAAAVQDLRAMAADVGRGLRLLGTAMVPISLGMLLLAPLLARVLYPGTTLPESRAIAAILVALVLGLVPYGVYLLCARVFYSFEDARTPFLFQVSITTTLLVVAVLSLTQPPGRVAVLLALGQALGQAVAAGLGLRAVRRRLPGLALRPVAGTFLRAAAAAAVALLPAWLLVRLLDRPGFLGAALTLLLAGTVYLALYAVLAHLLGVEEVAAVAGPVLRRVPGLSRLAPAAGPVPPAARTGGHDAREAVVAGMHEADALGWDNPPTGEDRKDTDMERLEVGTLLGERYALDELLARRDGGTLDYWVAHDTTLGRLVAVTVLPATGPHEPVAQAVVDGARRVASVDDPRLVRVLDVGTEDGLCWIVEEGLSEAESLASLVSDQPLPAEEVRRIIGETSAGLESARRRGLHHLYLNPHSILRTSDGTVKVSGVGMASALEGTDDVTAVEASLIDTADLVSLLYAGLTGEWPGEEMPGIRPARRLADGSVAAPSEAVGGVPGDLDALCRLVLGPDADLSRAPHTPGELARQLSPWASEMVRAARPGSLHHGRQGEPGEATTAAISRAAGAAAAATAAHPTRADESDVTSLVPKPFYRSGDEPAREGSTAYRPPDRHAAQDARRGTDPTGPGAGILAGAGTVETPLDPGAPTEATRRPSTAELLGVRSTGDPVAPSRGPRPAGARPAGAPPRPGDQDERGLREERGTGGQTFVVLLVVLGILGLAVVLGWSVLRGLGGDEAQTPAAPTATAPTTDAAGQTAPVAQDPAA